MPTESSPPKGASGALDNPIDNPIDSLRKVMGNQNKRRMDKQSRNRGPKRQRHEEWDQRKTQGSTDGAQRNDRGRKRAEAVEGDPMDWTKD